jgi:hydrogenase expression/formation protein HypE
LKAAGNGKQDSETGLKEASRIRWRQMQAAQRRVQQVESRDQMSGRVAMVHGSGGKATGELIDQIFASEFQDQTLDEMEDSALVAGCGRLALTTDSFVVTPVKFRGGDIGRLAVCGTVNDLLMRGAVPKYLTCGWILEEGTEIDLVREMAHSMAETAREAGIRIVAGDTKVIDGSIAEKSAGDAAGKYAGGILINTAGVGFVPEGVSISARNARSGDAILVSGTMGDHHAAILSERMSIRTDIESDNAPLTEIVSALVQSDLHIHTLRDITRGGLATVLKELAETSGRTFEIEQERIPVTAKVQDFCSLLGLDPLYMGNEGKLVCILPAEEAEEALRLIRSCRYGAGAVKVGEVTGDEPGILVMKTEIGGKRLLDVLQGEGLPRIC